MCKMRDRGGGRDRRADRDAQDDVGQLPDRRECQTLLDIVVRERLHRREQQRESSEARERHENTEISRQLGTVDEQHDARDSENARFDDRDRVQERANRCGGDHRRREPPVRREERCLHPEADHQKHEDRDERRRLPGIHAGGKNTAYPEVTAPADRIEPHHTERECRTPAERVVQVGAPSPERRRRARVHDERIGGQRERLVEDEEREEVGRERDSHRGPDTDGEEAEEPRPVTRVAHVASRVDRRHKPERARDDGEERAEPVGGDSQAGAKERETHTRRRRSEGDRAHHPHARGGR